MNGTKKGGMSKGVGVLVHIVLLRLDETKLGSGKRRPSLPYPRTYSSYLFPP